MCARGQGGDLGVCYTIKEHTPFTCGEHPSQGSVEKVFARSPQDDVAISKLPQINADRLPRFARNDRFPGFSAVPKEEN